MGNVVILMSNEPELRMRRVCFTGHRPEKLNKSEAEIVASLEREIRAAITDGFQTFISGMARGVDIWAAEVVLRLRDNGSPIHLIAASPYQGFERAWSPAWQSRYASALAGAISSVSFLRSMIVAASNAAMNGWSTTPVV